MIDSLLRTFHEEADELLASLEHSLLELEQNPDQSELVDAVFRALHTIKGSSAMVGYEHVASFTHELETVFDLVRRGSVSVSRDLIGLTLRARDEIRAMIDNNGLPVVVVAADVMGSLKERLAAHSPAFSQPVTPAEETVAKPVDYRILFRPALGLFQSGMEPGLFLNELRALGPCRIVVNTADVPPLDGLDPELCYLSWEIDLTTTCGEDAIKDVFIFVGEEAVVEIEALSGPQDDSSVNEASEEKSALATPRKQDSAGRAVAGTDLISSIRVPAQKLDQLVNLVGEMVTVQARLSQLATVRDDVELMAVAEEVERLTASLRDNTMNMRMLPIGARFNTFKRVVHDLAAELGKEVELATTGGDTELDKTVFEKLNDPLVHLIRNSLDHGIELPEQRLLAGKPRVGTIHLSARHAGDSILITVSDDGAGLDRERIFARAVQQGIISGDAELSEGELLSLIFSPGFSTAVEVSSISGRGVGMDVVKKAITALRGSISVQSRFGQGTDITLKIPLTLAIIESLLVKIGGDCFVVPLSLVEECVELTDADVARTHGRCFITVRDQIVPYIRLRDQFAMSGELPDRQQIVITEVDGRRIGFVVDYVVGEHQTVIKSLGRMYRDVPGVSGATILGDGTVALILDVHQLIRTEETAAAASF